MDDLRCGSCDGPPVIYWKSFPEHERQPSLHLRADCAECGRYIAMVSRTFASRAINSPSDPVVGRGARLSER